MYWSVYQLPEVAGLSKPEINMVWREARWSILKDPKCWACTIPWGIFAGIGSLFGVIGAAIGGGIAGFFCGVMVLNIARPHLADVIREGKAALK